MSGPVDRKQFDRITEQDAFEAEQVFLACMFANNTLIAESGIEPEDFSEEYHQMLFRQMQELARSGQPVNAISVKPHIPKVIRTDKKDENGLPIDFITAEYNTGLMSMGFDVATLGRLESSIHIIKGASLSRLLAREADIAAEIAKEGHTLLTLDEEIEQLEKRLKERRQRLSALKASAAPGSSYLAKFEASSRRDGVVGVPIALREIQNVLSEPAFEAGNLYGLLSSSGEGKSSLTMQLIYHAVECGHPVLFLSYDQSADQCISQMIAQVHGISMKKQREPMRLMKEEERDTCVRFATDINNRPLEIIRCQREGVEKLVAYARRFVKRYANGKTPFIVIDHIKKIKVRDPRLDAGAQSGEITVELKSLAYETQSAVLILNQRNGRGIERDNPRPIAADLHGGEGARADYDAVMTLYRPEKYKKERIKVASSDRDWKIIEKVFGSDVEGVAEIAAIKVRFGPPDVQEIVHFEAEFTRYISPRPKRNQGELI